MKEMKVESKRSKRIRRGISRAFFGLAVTTGLGTFGSAFYGPCYNGLFAPSNLAREHPEVMVYRKTQYEIKGLDSYLNPTRPEDGFGQALYAIEDGLEKVAGFDRNKIDKQKLRQEKQKLEDRQTGLRNMYPNIQENSEALDGMEHKEIAGLIGIPVGLVLTIGLGAIGGAFDPDERK